MKRLFSALFCLLMALTLPAEQAKRVYITLDVSASMWGAKYELANYTTQMLVTLCDEDDEVSLIVTGNENKLSKENNPLGLLQHPLNQGMGNPLVPAGANVNLEINDIIAFNDLYHPSKSKQDWAFVIGDGIWDITYMNASGKFGDIVKKGTLNVCHLQTGTTLQEDNPFAVFAGGLGVVDISKSDINPSSIKAGCDHFARKILGFSEAPLKIKKSGNDGINLKMELPVKEFYVVYQDEVAPEQLPDISSVEASDITFETKLKGTPSTVPLKEGGNWSDVTLSGNVWRVKANKTIPAGTKIEVRFDKDINLDNVNVYPIVENIDLNPRSMTLVGQDLKQLDDHTYSICRDENKATVHIELNGSSSEGIPKSLLKDTKVIVKSGNVEYEAKYKDGVFVCDIPLTGEETQYYAECDCPGYFKRVTPIMTIVKGKCEPDPPTPPVVDRKETVDFGTMTFDQLKNSPITGYMQDSQSLETLDPSKFDLSVEIENGFLYQKPSLSISGNTIMIDVRPKGDWCECLFPEDLNLIVVSNPKPGAFEATNKNYVRTEHPVHLRIEKNRPWIARCFWVIMTLTALLVLMAYLRGLLKKNRFHRGARLRNLYFVEDNPKEVEKNGKPLRKPGFGPWVDRWLNPFGDERNTTSFVRPKTRSMTFVASPSKNRILLTESSFDPKAMTVPNYTPKPKDKKEKEGEPIGISAGTSIEIKKMQGGESTRLGHLKYVVEGKDDEGGYRLFIGLLMAAAAIAFILLLWWMIRGLW